MILRLVSSGRCRSRESPNATAPFPYSQECAEAMTRVLLTGASGFIGSHVARRMLQKQVQVLAMVRPNSDYRRIDDIRNKLDLLEGSIEDCAALQNEIARFAPEVCIHLAWHSPGKLDNDQNDKKALEGSLRLLQLLRSTECRHFITAGTYTEYCSSAHPVSEDAPVCPATFYAKCKYELETTGQKMQKEA